MSKFDLSRCKGHISVTVPYNMLLRLPLG